MLGEAAIAATKPAQRQRRRGGDRARDRCGGPRTGRTPTARPAAAMPAVHSPAAHSRRPTGPLANARAPTREARSPPPPRPAPALPCPRSARADGVHGGVGQRVLPAVRRPRSGRRASAGHAPPAAGPGPAAGAGDRGAARRRHVVACPASAGKATAADASPSRGAAAGDQARPRAGSSGGTTTAAAATTSATPGLPPGPRPTSRPWPGPRPASPGAAAATARGNDRGDRRRARGRLAGQGGPRAGQRPGASADARRALPRGRRGRASGRASVPPSALSAGSACSSAARRSARVPRSRGLGASARSIAATSGAGRSRRARPSEGRTAPRRRAVAAGPRPPAGGCRPAPHTGPAPAHTRRPPAPPAVPPPARGHVGQRPHHIARARQRLVARQPGDPEIRQLGHPGRALQAVGHDHVLRLDVAVHHPAIVGVAQRAAQRQADQRHLAVRNRAGGHQLVQRASPHQLGDQMVAVLVRARLVQRHHRRVVQAGGGQRLTLRAVARTRPALNPCPRNRLSATSRPRRSSRATHTVPNRPPPGG